MATRTLNGATVRVIREALGITQHDLAERVGITQGALSNIEKGKSGATPETSRQLADRMGVPLESITYPTPEPAAI